MALDGPWIKRAASEWCVSVALFGQKLLDSLPIIFRKPSVCNQFNHLHKESVPIRQYRQHAEDELRAHETALSRPAQFLLGPAAPVTGHQIADTSPAMYSAIGDRASQ